MEKRISYIEARELLLRITEPIEKEFVPLENCSDRILGQNLVAIENVPPFDRSPYDGYAFRAVDTEVATSEHPVSLSVLEEVAAGEIPHYTVTEGYATKILTGAPIPDGADAVTKYELTEFTKETVRIFEPSQSGDNIIRTGEDVKVGDVLAECGTWIDPGLLGTLASQNIAMPQVYRKPKVGIISTGSELLEVGAESEPGKVYNSNKYMLSAALSKLGCVPIILGAAKDQTEEICEYILIGLKECDAVLLTGGVSVGDYDLTPAAMEMAGVEILFQGVDIKPGMACAYGMKDGKLVCGLSGNPASAMTNFYAVASPALKKLCGYKEALPTEIMVRLKDEFNKKSPATRFLRGSLDCSDGIVRMRIPRDQGNVVLSSTIGCNVMAVVPAGSGPLSPDTELKGFLI